MIKMNLSDLPSNPKARVQVVGDNGDVLDTCRRELDCMDLADLRSMIEFWQEEARSVGAGLWIDQEVASELIYQAYWSCVNAEIRIEPSEDHLSVLVKVALSGKGNLKELVIGILDAAQPDQIASWAEWAQGNIVEEAGITFLQAGEAIKCPEGVER